MKTTVNNIRYEIIKTGYGNWDVTRLSDNVTLHTTDSQMIDWIDDDSDEGEHQEAINALLRMFKR